MRKLKSAVSLGALHTHTHTHTHRCSTEYSKKGGSLFITSSLDGAKEEVESIME